MATGGVLPNVDGTPEKWAPEIIDIDVVLTNGEDDIVLVVDDWETGDGEVRERSLVIRCGKIWVTENHKHFF